MKADYVLSLMKGHQGGHMDSSSWPIQVARSEMKWRWRHGGSIPLHPYRYCSLLHGEDCRGPLCSVPAYAQLDADDALNLIVGIPACRVLGEAVQFISELYNEPFIPIEYADWILQLHGVKKKARASMCLGPRISAGSVCGVHVYKEWESLGLVIIEITKSKEEEWLIKARRMLTVTKRALREQNPEVLQSLAEELRRVETSGT